MLFAGERTYQWQKYIENLAFPWSFKDWPRPVFPLREFPLGGVGIGFVNAPLASSEVQNLKWELKGLLYHPFGVTVLGP